MSLHSIIRPPTGAGLGFRRDMLGQVDQLDPEKIAFLEVAPENWIGVGGRFGKALRALTERFTFITHGLSLSLGSADPLDVDLIRDIKIFLDTHQISVYTEHLSYCSDAGHLYDLMPIPFTEEAVHYVSKRISQVQDILERPIGVENVSYYAAPNQQMSEIDFFNAVVEMSGCSILLDINNIYVNSINHGYDALAFLKQMPADRAMYLHVAGHYQEAPDLRVDTHGADVVEPVWDLLAQAYQCFGVLPTLLERDFNIPPMADLLLEVERIKSIQSACLMKDDVASDCIALKAP